MDSATIRVMWISFALTVGMACIVALIQSKTAIHHTSVIFLVLLGCLAFSLAGYGLGWIQLPLWKMRSLFTIIAIISGMSCVGWYAWTPTLLPEPTLAPRLAIDSKDPNYVNFHLQLENGPARIQFKHLSLAADGFHWEQAHSDVLIAGGRLSITPPPFALRSDETNYRIDVLLNYLSGSTDFPFEYECTFFFSAPQINHGNVIDPERCTLKSGAIANDPQVKRLLDAFFSPSGTVFVVIPDTLPDGRDNVVTISAGGKRFHFNARTRLTTFSFQLNERSLLYVKQLCPRSAKHLQAIIFQWDSVKEEIMLRINEKETKQSTKLFG